jgi:hypothetical protein
MRPNHLFGCHGEFVLPGFGKLVKQKRKARIGINPKIAAEDQNPGKDGRQIPGRGGGKRRSSWSEKIVLAHADPQDEVSPEK